MIEIGGFAVSKDSHRVSQRWKSWSTPRFPKLVAMLAV